MLFFLEKRPSVSPFIVVGLLWAPQFWVEVAKTTVPVQHPGTSTDRISRYVSGHPGTSRHPGTSGHLVTSNIPDVWWFLDSKTLQHPLRPDIPVRSGHLVRPDIPIYRGTPNILVRPDVWWFLDSKNAPTSRYVRTSQNVQHPGMSGRIMVFGPKKRLQLAYDCKRRSKFTNIFYFQKTKVLKFMRIFIFFSRSPYQEIERTRMSESSFSRPSLRNFLISFDFPNIFDKFWYNVDCFR